jgi:hypothetical protein
MAGPMHVRRRGPSCTLSLRCDPRNLQAILDQRSRARDGEESDGFPARRGGCNAGPCGCPDRRGRPPPVEPRQVVGYVLFDGPHRLGGPADRRGAGSSASEMRARKVATSSLTRRPIVQGQDHSHQPALADGLHTHQNDSGHRDPKQPSKRLHHGLCPSQRGQSLQGREPKFNTIAG